MVLEVHTSDRRIKPRQAQRTQMNKSYGGVVRKSWVLWLAIAAVNFL
ncbi:hypothetical protein [Fischerella thermalis]|jgi:hypothetical protein|nr:hypothetical protein [Fischerella thermalis]